MPNLYADRPKLEKIAQIISPHIELLLDSLDIQYKRHDKYFIGKCPVHSGHNPTSWRMYTENDRYDYCGWCCFSSNCHKDCGNSPYGLVRGVNNVEWRASVDYVLELYKIDPNSITITTDAIDKAKFNKQINILGKKPIKCQSRITRADVRQRLVIPAEFYIRKGFDKKILDEYDIGLCLDKTKFMKNRVVVPIYDDNHQYLFGCTGRTVIDDYEIKGFTKWLHSSGFNPKNTLFNWWMCKDAQSIIIVESVGNALKLIQGGQQNVVAIFGTSLSDQQQIVLECSKIRNVYLALDNDKAGESSSKKIKKQLSRLFNVYELPIEYYGYEDIGAMTHEAIQRNIKIWQM